MTTQTQPVAEEKKHFNMYLDCIGYLNNVSTITYHKQSYLKVSVTVLMGPADKVEYRYFSCTVVGTEAKQLISHCAQEINSGQTVVACFKLSGLWTRSFTHQTGEFRGQPDTRLISNLLSLSLIKIDGEVVYHAPKEEESDVDSANAAQTSNPLDTTNAPETAYDSASSDIGDLTDITEAATVAHHAV
ncbi:DUF3577 domain-containing protein [Pseudomonas sp.]|uniref:DUF3577 domain-containing protein n=1 Tax=Pseudomonas sp. TaxID=306 RepID=UPI003F9845EB